MEKTKNRRVLTFLGATLVMSSLLAVSAPVAAGDAGQVQREGSCSGNADWRLEVEPEDGGLQVDLRIRQDDQPGRVWDIRIRQNGERFFRANRTTDEDGEIRIRRQRPDTAGDDRFFFKAIGPGGQVCAGGLTI